MSRNLGYNEYIKQIDINWLIDYYILFYRGLRKFKDDLVASDFKDVLNDFGSVIKRVNDKVGTSFVEFDYT